MTERIVKIGNPRGRIALYLDEAEAHDLAAMYGSSDLFFGEMMAAIEEAYPDVPRQEHGLGLRIVVKPDSYGRLAPGFETFSDGRYVPRRRGWGC